MSCLPEVDFVHAVEARPSRQYCRHATSNNFDVFLLNLNPNGQVKERDPVCEREFIQYQARAIVIDTSKQNIHPLKGIQDLRRAKLLLEHKYPSVRSDAPDDPSPKDDLRRSDVGGGRSNKPVHVRRYNNITVDKNKVSATKVDKTLESLRAGTSTTNNRNPQSCQLLLPIPGKPRDLSV